MPSDRPAFSPPGGRVADVALSPADAASQPVVVRLSRLVALNADEIAALRAAPGEGVRRVPRQRVILQQGAPVPRPSIILSGWAARARLLPDGRRQIISLLLPGDLIGHCSHDNPVAASSFVAVTTVTTCLAPPGAAGSPLARAYAASSALEHAYLLAQVTRVGRLTAFERLADMFLELHERLSLAGLTDGHRLPMPLTQEMIGDATGLTSVHVNRTLKALREADAITLGQGSVTITDPVALALVVDRQPTRISAG